MKKFTNRKLELKREARDRKRKELGNNRPTRIRVVLPPLERKFKTSNGNLNSFIKEECLPTVDKTKVNLFRSFGESEIEHWLVKHKIEYEIEKEFDDLINPLTNKNLRMDFYIASHNVCIEFDGRQHYSVSKKFDKGDKKLFSIRKARDQVKNEYCDKKGILMVRIKFSKIKLIPYILTEVLLNKKRTW